MEQIRFEEFGTIKSTYVAFPPANNRAFADSRG